MRQGFTLIELMVVIVIISIILSVGFGSCYSSFSKEEYIGTVTACENITNNIYNTNSRTISRSQFSFACDIKCDNGEIISFSSEDRKFATVVKNDVIRVAVSKYAPWNFDKAGTFYNGRLLKKIKAAE